MAVALRRETSGDGGRRDGWLAIIGAAGRDATVLDIRDRGESVIGVSD
ncbi:MAG: hypothetical protein ACKOCW_13170 [Planctomycetaceae bacterium]